MLVATNLSPKLAIKLPCVEQRLTCPWGFNRGTDDTAAYSMQCNISLYIMFLFTSCNAVACFLVE